MALTQKQIEEMDAISGLKTPAPTPVNVQAGMQRADELRKIAASAEERKLKAKETIPEKILNFTGGKEIAQGLGQAMAQKGNTKLLDETQKMQMEIQGNVIKAIKERKARGEDTTRLEKALKDLSFEMSATGLTAERTLNPYRLSKKEVIGDALQLGTTIASVGTYGKAGTETFKLAAKKTMPSAVSTVTKGVGTLKGAGLGAAKGAGIGAAEGAAYGAAQGLKDDKDAAGIVKDAGKGALFGAAVGGVLGGATGGVSGAMKAKKLAKETQHLDAITPKVDDLPAAQYKEALGRGKIVEKTAHEPAKYVLSEGEKAVATKYKHLLQGGDPVVNINNIAKEVAKKDTEVGTFLRKNNRMFNTGELKNSLIERLKNVDDITISEDRITKVKNETIENFIKSLKKNNMETLWQSRKDFDRLTNAFKGAPSFKKEMAREFRNAVQDFIADRTPDNVYKTAMKEMSELINLSENNLTLKAVNERKLSALAKWAKDHPNKAKLLWGAIGAAGLAGGAKVVEAAVE